MCTKKTGRLESSFEVVVHVSRFSSERYIARDETRCTRETEQVRGIAFELWRYSGKCEYVFHNLRFDLDRRARARTSQKLIIAPMLTRARFVRTVVKLTEA